MVAVLYEGGLILNSLNMKKINLFFIMILLLSIHGKGSGLQYMSNFKFEDLVFGEENLVKDYVTLANDPKANFPDTFTVCSSLFVKFFATDNDIITMLKEDGTPWITLTMRVRDEDFKSLSEMYVSDVSVYVGIQYIYNTVIPIVPHSWYHICMGVDSASGLLRIIVNGIEVVNVEVHYLKNQNEWKPLSLVGKVYVFKISIGFWVQTRSTFSNLNIFSSMMSAEDMVIRTSGGDGCSSPGDYLRLFKFYIFGF